MRLIRQHWSWLKTLHTCLAIVVVLGMGGWVISPDPAYSRVELGLSTLGWPIESYQFGRGPLHVALVGGIHGGYEWNTILLAYQVIDHYSAHPEQVPDSITLHIIPAANPDGLVAVVGHTGRFSPEEVGPDTIPGRFNGNGADLNRNWGCDWEPTAFWGQQEVPAGAAPWSEVETRLLRDYLTGYPMQAVVLWHSALGSVFVGACDTPSAEAMEIAGLYAQAAQYHLFDAFSNYPVTGDASDWLASQDIPAITVELDTHHDTDLSRNLAGVQALLHFLDASHQNQETRPASPATLP